MTGPVRPLSVLSDFLLFLEEAFKVSYYYFGHFLNACGNISCSFKIFIPYCICKVDEMPEDI